MDGQEVVFPTPRSAFDAGICVVHQELNYIPALTVAENIMMSEHPRTKHGFVDWKKIRTESKKVLEEIGTQHIDINMPMLRWSDTAKRT